METTLVFASVVMGLGDRLVPDGRGRSCAAWQVGPGAAERVRFVRASLDPLDLVPIGSCWRCRAGAGTVARRSASNRSSSSWPTRALFVLFGLKFGAEAVLAAYCCLAAALVALAWIDLQELRLPREITYAASISLMTMMNAAVIDQPDGILMMLLGAGIALLIMGVIFFASRGGMGDGDVAWPHCSVSTSATSASGIVPVGLFFGFLIGAVVGVAMMATSKAGARRRCRSVRSSPPAPSLRSSRAAVSST